MPRPLARAIVILLAPAFAFVGLAPSRADDPKPQAEKKAVQSAGAKETGKTPAAGGGAKPKDAPAAAKPSSDKDAPAAAKPAATAPAPASAAAPKTVSFIRDVAPILVENCIACHNPRKSESKYVMTTFNQLAKGGQQGEGVTLAAGKPEESYIVELIRPAASRACPTSRIRSPPRRSPRSSAGSPRVRNTTAAHRRRTGRSTCRKTQNVSVPESYPAAVPITALEFTRDGSAVAASGYHEVTFWKTGDGTLARRLGGLAERTYDIAYSPDGKWMATASGDPGIFGVARLWSAEPGPGAKPVRDLVETQDVVFSVAFSPDSKRLATAGADRAIRVFEVETGKLLFQVEDHADWIFAVAFSPDGKRLASASRDKTCKVFDVNKKEALVTFPGHAAAGLHDRLLARRQDGRQRRRRQRDPDLEPRRRWQAGPRTRRLRRHRLPPPLLARWPGTRRLQRGQDGANLQGERILAAQAARPAGLDLLAGHLQGLEDDRLGELGRRRAALEPRRRQVDPQLHRGPRLQAPCDHEGRSPLILGADQP